MLEVVQAFKQDHASVKPIIVADAAMLSEKNMQTLEAEGYQYIVGARLANTTQSLLSTHLP